MTTAGQAITQQTGGAGLNFVVKRGTNLFHGGVRGYFDNESTGVVERARPSCGAAGVTPETADHNKQISDFGVRHRRTAACATRRGSTAPTRFRT